MSINLSYVKDTSEKLRRITTTHKIRSPFCPSSRALNYFVNLKMDLIQKIKKVSLLKMTIITVKKSTLLKLISF